MDEIKGVNDAWGVRFNSAPDWQRLRKNQRPDGCPEWANHRQIEQWQKEGLVCWNNETKQFEHLNGKATLELLKTLRDSKQWVTQGVSIQHFARVFQLDHQTTPSRRKKKGEADSELQSRDKPILKDREEGKWVEDVRLPPEAGDPLIALLQRNELALTSLAEREEQATMQAMQAVYDLLLGAALRGAAKNVDLSKYALGWRFDDNAHKFICDLPPKRATVYSIEKTHTWAIDIECPDEPVWTVNFFSSPDSALKWAEEQLQKREVPLEPRPPERPLTDWSRELKRAYGKRWIDPKKLEPERITYNVILEVSLKAISFKSVRMSFGGFKQVADQFASPLQVEQNLKLKPGYFTITQLLSSEGWYRAVSATTFRESAMAQMEAQRVWSDSAVMSEFRAERLLCARYGIVEKETNFRSWVGECGDAIHFWGEETSRPEHMLHLAVVTSIEAELDVVRYRAFLGLRSGVFTDDRLLKMMHEQRAKSRFLSAEMRAESAAWLVMHGLQDQSKSSSADK